MDPVIAFFIFGFLAGLMRSPIQLPNSAYQFLSAYLLLAIGFKGGIELSHSPVLELAPKALSIGLLGMLLPLVAYPVLKKFGRFKKEDAASIAAHYGSVSVGTFAVGLTFLQSSNISFEPYVPLFVVILEIPAIIIGIILARGIEKGYKWKELVHEVFLGKSIVLMLIGLFVGWLSSPEQVESVNFLFKDLFKGALCLFLLEMGVVTSKEVRSLKSYGAFLIAFGIFMPLFSGMVGAFLGYQLGLSLGGATVVAILAASSSYIAVPAAMRISVPEANPSLSLGASLGITFPFNVLIGIPLYHKMVSLFF